MHCNIKRSFVTVYQNDDKIQLTQLRMTSRTSAQSFCFCYRLYFAPTAILFQLCAQFSSVGLVRIALDCRLLRSSVAKPAQHLVMQIQIVLRL